MKARSVEWAAGLLEGEGSFAQPKPNCVQVVCQMTDRDVIESLRETFQVGTVSGPFAGRKSHHKPTYTYRASGNDAVSVMQRILPYMGVRRSERIVELLSVRVSFSSRLKERQNEIKKRNLEVIRLSLENLSLRKIATMVPGCSHETVRRIIENPNYGVDINNLRGV